MGNVPSTFHKWSSWGTLPNQAEKHQVVNDAEPSSSVSISKLFAVGAHRPNGLGDGYPHFQITPIHFHTVDHSEILLVQMLGSLSYYLCRFSKTSRVVMAHLETGGIYYGDSQPFFCQIYSVYGFGAVSKNSTIYFKSAKIPDILNLLLI